MAIIVATAAATVNILMAFYNVAKDAIGLSKRKSRDEKKLEIYKDSLQWKKESLQRTRAGASRKVDRFGTETIRLHNHWGQRVDKADAKLDQFLKSCENAKSFRKRAQLGEKGSVLAKEVEKVEADGKIFYDPSYRTRRNSQLGPAKKALAADTISMISSSNNSSSWNSTRSNSSSSIYSSNSSSWNSTRSMSSRNSYMTASTNKGNSSYLMSSSGSISSTSGGGSQMKSSSSNWSTVAVTGSPTWSTVAVPGSRGLLRLGASSRYN